MNVRLKAVAQIMFGLIVGAGLTSYATAHAAYRRQSASSCRTPSGSAAQVFTSGYASGGNLVCPYIDDSVLPHQSATGTLYVDMSAQSAGVANSSNPATACVWYFTGTGGACGPNAYATAAGWNSLAVSRSAWTAHTSDYPFVSVSPNSTTSFAGFFFTQ